MTDNPDTTTPLLEVTDYHVGFRTERGGSWQELRIHGRTYFHRPALAERRQYTRGFRCAKSVD